MTKPNNNKNMAWKWSYHTRHAHIYSQTIWHTLCANVMNHILWYFVICIIFVSFTRRLAVLVELIACRLLSVVGAIWRIKCYVTCANNLLLWSLQIKHTFVWVEREPCWGNERTITISCLATFNIQYISQKSFRRCSLIAYSWIMDQKIYWSRLDAIEIYSPTPTTTTTPR